MEKFFVRATVICILFVLVAPAPLQAAPEKINASYGAISGSMAPIWVAKEARLFEKQGFDFNLVYIPGGPRSIMSLIGNSIQFVNHSGMPALEAYQRGADTAMIASSMNQLEHAIIAQKNIANVEQLRGKVLGISALASLTDILMREGLRLNGITDKEVTILPVGDESGRLNSLQIGRVQAVIISGIQRLTAIKMGFKLLIDFSKLPIEVSVISVADTYDAMTTDRPYRKGLAWDAVRAELVRQRGKQWRELAVDCFIEMIDEEHRKARMERPELTSAPVQPAAQALT